MKNRSTELHFAPRYNRIMCKNCCVIFRCSDISVYFQMQDLEDKLSLSESRAETAEQQVSVDVVLSFVPTAKLANC